MPKGMPTQIYRLSSGSILLIDENCRAYEVMPNARRGDKRVYFALAEDQQLVKIGVGRNVWKRLEQIQTSCPYKLRIVAVLEDGHLKEQELHRRFAAYRLQGEWFRYEGELKSFIDEICICFNKRAEASAEYVQQEDLTEEN